MKTLRLLGIVVPLITMVSACNTDELQFDNIYIEDARPIILSELGTINYSIGELLGELESDDFEVDSSDASVIKLAFSDSFALTKKDLVDDTNISEFEDINETIEIQPFPSTFFFANTTGSPREIDLTPFDIVDTIEYAYALNPENRSLYETVFYKGGTLVLSVTNDEGITFEYTLLSTNTFDVEPNNDTTYVLFSDNRVESSLAGLRTVFATTETETDPVSEFILRLTKATLPVGGSISAITTVDVNVETRGLADITSIEALYAVFSTDTIDVAGDSIAFDALDDFTSGEFKFNNPQVNISVKNYLGIPTEMDLSKLVASTKDRDNVSFFGVQTSGAIQTVEASEFRTNEFENVVPANSVVSLNRDNSDIVDIFSEIPTSFNFPITAIVNPSPRSSGFMALPENDDDTIISVITTVELPLNITFDNVVYPIDIDGINVEEDVNEADSAHIKIIAENGLPLTVVASIGFFDANNQEIAPRTQGVELVTAETATEEILGLSKSEIEALLDAENLKVFISLSSPPNVESRIGVGETIKMTISAYIEPIISIN